MGTLMEPFPSTETHSALLVPDIIQITDVHHKNGNTETLQHKNKHEILLEDDKPVLPGIAVRGATLEALIEFLVNAFETSGRILEEHSNFPRVFFLMHKWFTTSEHLASLLMSQYYNAEDVFGHSCTCHSSSTVEECCVCKFRKKVCQAFRYWIQKFPMHFDMDSTLGGKVKDFQADLLNSRELNLSSLLDLSKIPKYDWMRNMSVRNPASKHSRKVSLVFNHLEPDELADHLTFLEHKVMRRISFQDFINYAQTGSLMENAKLERSIALFNGLSQWIQCMVLSKTTPQHRADVIVKFVNTSKRLLALQNFNTLMAVVGGLSHSALARLSKTSACIPPETHKVLMDMTDLLSSASNFANYRRALGESKGFRLPILGVHMKDLISLHVALPDYLENKLINFRKMAQLSYIFQELSELQNSTPPLEANMDLVNTLRLSLDLSYTEDEIYELSLAKEPRNSMSPQASPLRPVVFAEWAAGVMNAPDPVIIKKHVHAMVEAVFKNYDSDRDGYISQNEFEAIAGNFPFVDSFCVLDADQDGMISKQEMQDYFIQANCLAFRNGFKHDFHETTYFKPTYCVHCLGLLWGLIKQGYKCKDCAINAHKHCKDLVVKECRKNRQPPHGRSMSVSGTTDAAVSRARFRNRRRHQKSFPSDAEPLLSPVSFGSNGVFDNTENDETSLLSQRLARAEEVQNCELQSTCGRKHSLASTTIRNSRRTSSLERPCENSTSVDSPFCSECDGDIQCPERYRSMSS